MEQIKVGVIGIGSMGKHHLRLYSELPQFHLVGFYDPKHNKCVFAERYGIIVFSDLDSLLKNCDAVSIVAPSSLHLDIALKVAAKGKHALVEKPLALNPDEGRRICDAFNKTGGVLMVGHVERFNPVTIAIEKLLNIDDVIAINLRRCSPWISRVTDVDVLQDLMIHDVDIVINALVKQPVKNICAFGSIVYSNSMLDYVQALIRFENGIIASFSASRITEDKIRDIQIHTKNLLIRADLLNYSLIITRQVKRQGVSENDLTRQRESATEKVLISVVDPLRLELEEFASCIMNNRKPKTDGNSSIRVLEILGTIRTSALEEWYEV
jgi:predicted dehydrogenase